MPEAVPPSPKLHCQPAIVPSGSVEPEPLNESAMSVCAAWSAPAFARGGWFGAVEVVVLELVVVVVGREVEVDVDVLVVVGREVLDEVDVLELVGGGAVLDEVLLVVGLVVLVDVLVVVGRVVLVDVLVVVGRVVLDDVLVVVGRVVDEVLVVVGRVVVGPGAVVLVVVGGMIDRTVLCARNCWVVAW